MPPPPGYTIDKIHQYLNFTAPRLRPNYAACIRASCLLSEPRWARSLQEGGRDPVVRISVFAYRYRGEEQKKRSS